MDSQLLWPAEKRLPQMSYFHTYKLLYRQKVGHLNQKKKKKVTLHGKKDVEDWVKDFDMGQLPWIIWLAQM